MTKSLFRTNKEIADIYKRQMKTVYRVCFAFMKNPFDTEDAVQDTFYKMIKPGVVFESEERMLDTILARNNAGKAGKEKVFTMIRTLNWKRLAPLAACLVLAIAIAMPFLNKGSGDFDLRLSDGVKVSYVDKPPTIQYEYSLVGLSEDELFASNFNSYEIIAFEGTVKEVRNIVCDYNGRKDYRAIATIEVSEVLRGSLEAGKTATVLLPAPVGTDIKIEDTIVSSQIRAGTRGIFTPIKYDDTSIRETINI